MNRSLKLRTIPGVIALGVAYATSASAQSAEPSNSGPPPTLQAQIERLVARPGGLTAEQAAARARATSFDAKSRHADAMAAQAGRIRRVQRSSPRRPPS